VTQIGNHYKFQTARTERSRVREFYRDLLGCQMREGPMPHVDMFQFEGGAYVGIFFEEPDAVLTPENFLKAAWMELKTKDPAALEKQVRAFGVKAIDYADKTRFYFQAPGGQVFRVAPLESGA
jgi:hypothetical protein